MNIETVLLIVIVTFACGFVLDRWNVRLSRSRRRQAAGGRRIAQSLDFAGTFSLETRRRYGRDCGPETWRPQR